MQYRYPGRKRPNIDWGCILAVSVGWLTVAFVIWMGWGKTPW